MDNSENSELSEPEPPLSGGAPGSGPASSPEQLPVERPRADTDPGRGRRIGIDVGTVRIGIAASDPDGILATPVETVATVKGSKRGPATDLMRVAEIVREYEAVEVIIGLPRTLRGGGGSSARMAMRFADRLRNLIPGVPIRLSDERLTTVSAARALRDSGVRSRGRRQVIDQAAAVSILQGWLDERSVVLNSAGADEARWSDE
ncbi:Holliday junction resolvase RuvX [Nocardia vermiculata]|uniref:Putative pre-16S rRNA nuclease n=1 Tax=Nocardia vermiculata TaxID=257274 RepID=A0A846Y3G3_9NOCA|nr:Holliday junction resolvase RuvX [Nocardia vermiculata]NKY51179.1 Holliday junction resolvase RuvX [Nocardia vermiculata]